MPTLDLKLAQHFLLEEPRGAARRLELEAPEVAAGLLKTLPSHAAVEVLCLLQAEFAADVLLSLPEVEASRWLEQMELADIAAVLRHSTEADFARLLSLLSQKKQNLCRMLASYPDYTVGAWVETDVVVLDVKMTVEEAMHRLRKRHYKGGAQLYVVDQQRQLVGQVSIFNLLRRTATEVVASFLDTKVLSLSGFTELAGALKAPVWAQQDQVAVVSRQGDFLGELHHHKVRSALQRNTPPAPLLEATDLLDAYASSFASLVDVFTPTPKSGN
ncbi:magnesium transporter MgtE N-terminal domain-containing protein [Pseudoalteromonas fenneropenaei]|uniref:Magnesium transporter MgtE N-terminal domain-containing protein n=1 Tax=Pseudoalteromonas fenneropenaei TaxID=1737459 RepID=A0ABV7CKX4_9GAMM